MAENRLQSALIRKAAPPYPSSPANSSVTGLPQTWGSFLMSISGKLTPPAGLMLSTNRRLRTVNKLLIKPFLVISIYRTEVVFLADKFASAIWDLTTWQHGSSATTINKKSDAGTFSHRVLHNRSVVRAQGKRKEVAWTLRAGMSEVLALLPLGSAAGE